MTVGYVYILSNPLFPGLLKIGYTTDTVKERAADLSGTGVPMAFEVEYWCLTAGADEVERRVHEKFAACRENKRREFFRLDIDDAIAEIERLVVDPPRIFRRLPSRQLSCSKCGHRFDDFGKDFCPACGCYGMSKVRPRP
jgi:hypothetical protein